MATFLPVPLPYNYNIVLWIEVISSNWDVSVNYGMRRKGSDTSINNEQVWSNTLPVSTTSLFLFLPLTLALPRASKSTQPSDTSGASADKRRALL